MKRCKKKCRLRLRLRIMKKKLMEMDEKTRSRERTTLMYDSSLRSSGTRRRATSRFARESADMMRKCDGGITHLMRLLICTVWSSTSGISAVTPHACTTFISFLFFFSQNHHPVPISLARLASTFQFLHDTHKHGVSHDMCRQVLQYGKYRTTVQSSS